MVKIKKDLTGQTFGRLKVVNRAEDCRLKNGTNIAQWVCECSCLSGKEVILPTNRLTTGNTKSCGCLHSESALKKCENNKKRNKYEIKGDVVIGKSSNTEDLFYLDIDDYDKIKDYCWRVEFVKGIKRLRTTLHRERKSVMMHGLLGFASCDHISRNQLDNRKCNLRPATRFENAMNHSLRKDNTTGVIGVNLNKKGYGWTARIKANKKEVYLGLFSNKDDAIRARLQAEKEYFGAFAPQQNLYEQYGVI